MSVYAPTPEHIERAAEALRQGRLVAFPTETVYGLGADATNDRAVASIYEAKGRPSFNPLIIHFADSEAPAAYVEIPPLAKKAIAAFWPGPLTLVLPRRASSKISLLASAGLETLAIRFPAHPVAQRLIAASGLPIAAPSANASGKLSPTEAAHVVESLGEKVEIVLDGGPTRVGVESTVLDLTTETPTILRHGGVTKEQLEVLFESPVEQATGETDAPKSPGMLLSHYAPALPVRLNVREAGADEAFLTFGPEEALKGGKVRLNLSVEGSLPEAAANLFSYMRKLDDPSFSGIAVAPLPEEGMGAAILDRLTRAARPRS